MSYLQKRGSIWYVRLRIPKELLVHFWPQTEIRKSLQTSRLTHARKLAHKTLHELQQSFFEMRYATPMEQRPPSKLALEIFKKMYPHLSPDHAITYNVKGRAVTTWPLELMSIQDALDEGYRPNEAGVLDFEHGTHQAPSTNGTNGTTTSDQAQNQITKEDRRSV